MATLRSTLEQVKQQFHEFLSPTVILHVCRGITGTGITGTASNYGDAPTPNVWPSDEEEYHTYTFHILAGASADRHGRLGTERGRIVSCWDLDDAVPLLPGEN